MCLKSQRNRKWWLEVLNFTLSKRKVPASDGHAIRVEIFLDVPRLCELFQMFCYGGKIRLTHKSRQKAINLRKIFFKRILTIFWAFHALLVIIDEIHILCVKIVKIYKFRSHFHSFLHNEKSVFLVLKSSILLALLSGSSLSFHFSCTRKIFNFHLNKNRRFSLPQCRKSWIVLSFSRAICLFNVDFYVCWFFFSSLLFTKLQHFYIIERILWFFFLLLFYFYDSLAFARDRFRQSKK